MVSSLNDEGLHNDVMRLGFFTCAGVLMTCTKSESENWIKLQGGLQITKCNTCPADVLNPENDANHSDIPEDHLINDDNDLVIEEDSLAEVQLEAIQVLEDMGNF